MFERRKYPAVALQKWNNIFFLHWRVDERLLQAMIPEPLVIDTFHERAWITIVIFQAKYSRPRLFPRMFSLKDMYQINVRTYVTHPTAYERGVYFFALRVAHPFITRLLQKMFSLPFIRTHITWREEIDGLLHVSCQERDKLIFQCTCTTTSKRHHSQLAPFLTERYCIWNVHRGKIIKLPLSHSSWNLYEGSATVFTNELLPLEVDGPPLVHYAVDKNTILHPYETHGYYDNKSPFVT